MNHKLTMTPEMTKVVNKNVVLNFLLANSPTSRAEIARTLQLSKPTVSMIVSELVDEGLARETGVKQSGLGRPWVNIELNPLSRFAIGLELGTITTRVIVTDLLARPVDCLGAAGRSHIDASTPDKAALGLAQAINHAIDQLRESNLIDNRGKARVVGIGIGVPAVVDSQTQEIIGSNPLNWSGPTPFGSIIQQHVSVPILVTQRVMAAAWAERTYGLGRHVQSLVYARIGSGVAAGIVLNNQLYTGISHYAGNLAGMTFLAHGSSVDLLQPVSLQALVTREALMARARQLLLGGTFTTSSALDAAGGNPAAITLELLCQGALQDDPLCRKVIAEAGNFVGLALANVVNILNPAMVVLGGPLAQAGQIFLQAVREQIQASCNRNAYQGLEVCLSEVGEQAPALGAASLAIRQFLSPTALPDIRQPLAGHRVIN